MKSPINILLHGATIALSIILGFVASAIVRERFEKAPPKPQTKWTTPATWIAPNDKDPSVLSTSNLILRVGEENHRIGLRPDGVVVWELIKK